jgi:hypothetical protein
MIVNDKNPSVVLVFILIVAGIFHLLASKELKLLCQSDRNCNQLNSNKQFPQKPGTQKIERGNFLLKPKLTFKKKRMKLKN